MLNNHLRERCNNLKRYRFSCHVKTSKEIVKKDIYLYTYILFFSSDEIVSYFKYFSPLVSVLLLRV